MSQSMPSVLATFSTSRGEQVDAEAHVAGAHDDGVARGGLEPGEIVVAHAGRADDMDDARLRRQRRHFDGRRGSGEIDHAVGLKQRGERVVGDRDAERAEPGQFAGVAAERGRAGPLQRAGEHRALGRGDGLDQHLAHAPGGADDDKTHLGHGEVSGPGWEQRRWRKVRSRAPKQLGGSIGFFVPGQKPAASTAQRNDFTK